METISAGQVKDLAAAEETEETVEIFECAREAQVEATTKLATDFRQMVNNPAFSDVAFMCTDGKKVHACKIILAGRSNYLKSMFVNGMAESNLCELKSGMTSLVLLSVFEFLYTGTLIDYLPTSWRTACEVVDASRFFLLTQLEMIIRKVMQTQIDSIIEDLPTVASLLTEAVEFKVLCDQKDVTLRVLVKILGSNLSDSKFIEILSEDAFHYFLANSKGKCDLDKLSFREYLRFRQVIRWWVYQCDLGSEELVEFIAPDIERALFICRNQSKLEVVQSPEEETEEEPASLSNEWNSLQLDESLRNTVIRLLSTIDYRCIHPVLLAEVVEPLKISSPDVMSAFRFHAVRRPMVFKTLEWEHSESYDTAEQGYVIRRTGIGKEMAKAVVMNAAMSPPCGRFRWNFILDQLSEAVIQLGFVYGGESKGAGKPKLDGASPYWTSFRGSDFLVNYAINPKKDPPIIKNSIDANSPLLFSFDAFKQTCSFSLLGRRRSWSNLPSGIYYPAVKLDHSYKGRVRIELVSGFEIL